MFQVAQSEVIKSIDRAIQAIHYEATRTSNYTHTQRQNLKLLSQHRDHVLKNTSSSTSGNTEPSVKSPKESITRDRRSSKRAAPAPPTRTSQLSSSDSSSYPSLQTGDESQQNSSSSTLLSDECEPKKDADIQTGNTSPAVPREVHSVKQGTRKGKLSNDSDLESHQFSDVSVKSDRQYDDINIVDHHYNDVDSPVDNSYVVIPKGSDPVSNDRETAKQRTLPAADFQPLSTSPSKYLSSPTGNLQLSPSKFLQSPTVINFESLTVPDKMASDIVEQLREHTGLSYPKSCLAVEIVLGQVAARLPQMASVMDRILMTFSEGETPDEESTYDGKMLQDLLTKLTECKDDAQQRSWSLFKDQQTISGYLEELLSILENAKLSVCRKVLANNRYEALHNLVEYYQMETRVSLRMLLLKCFGAMCQLEASVISNLLYSILPCELVSEIQNKFDNVDLICYVAIVLSMILSTGEPLPSNLSDHVNHQFISCMFELIEKPPSPQFEDEAVDQLVIVLLALNLHYTEYRSNPIMSVLAEKGTVKTFTEKLLILFNRGDDPVKMFEFQSSQQNSVMKFVTDLFRDKATASLLYTNDAKVLVDIIIRHLTDLQPGDEVRTCNLVLANHFVENSDYLNYRHRESELCRSLHNILHEESSINMDDKVLVSDILDKIQDFT